MKDCHKAVGTFPNKTFLLDNDSTLEVFDQYYIYTTRTNAAGDYMICGVPTGSQTLHMDLDLSDCGILGIFPAKGASAHRHFRDYLRTGGGYMLGSAFPV